VKRRGFLQAIVGAAAAVTVPKVAAQAPKEGVAALADSVQQRMLKTMLAQAERVCNPPLCGYSTDAMAAWWIDQEVTMHTVTDKEMRESK
jgi:hypothetical protein